MKNKGISTIVATILMLMILLALVSSFYLYISGFFKSKTLAFSVVSEYGSTFSLWNMGSESINDIHAFSNGAEIPFYIECPSNVIFSDDFDDGNSNGWNVINGNWLVSSKTYEGDSISSGVAQSFVNLNYSYSTVQIQFKIGNLKPVDVMLMIDRSGSMDGQKISDAKTAAKSFVDQLNPSKDKSGLVSFNETATLDQVITSDQSMVKSKIDPLVANGNTNVGDAIYIATNQLRSNGRSDSAWFEILLTDGQPNRPNDVNYGVKYAINASLNASYYGIMIYTIGLGVDANATLLQQIANNTNGKYYYAPNSSTLNQIYKEIAGEISSGAAGIILKRDNTDLAKISAMDSADRIDIIDKNGNTVNSGNFTIENNTFYNLKVVSSGSKIFVNINGVDVADGDIGDSGPKNRLSLFSSQSLVLFDNVSVMNNSFDPGRTCNAVLFNFTSIPGIYTVVLRSPNVAQQTIITVT